MKLNGTHVLLLGVAAAAFALGRIGFTGGTGAPAFAQDMTQEMDPEMMAWIEAGTPGEHHRQLDPLVGEWAGSFKIWMKPDAEPMVSEGTISREWVLDGHFIRETVEATAEGETFRAVAYLGYNNIDGRFEFVWLESMSTNMYFETGSFDPDSKVLSTQGSNRDPVTKKLMQTFGTVDMSNNNRHVYTSYAIGPDGRKFKTFEGVAERVSN